MRVLHLSDYALPDWRIEKSAISALNRNHQVLFAGLPSRTGNSVFEKTFEINWTPRARRAFPYYWYCVKKQLKKIVREVRPDIVHAHNIFSAKMVSEIGTPFVYDDHEYWPSYVRRQIESYNSSLKQSNWNNNNNPRRIIQKTILRLLNSRFLKLGLSWEKQLVSSTPTITVSENIARELRELGNTDRVFITPNFPTINEIKDIQPPKFHKELTSVYAGIEPKNNSKIAHRNMDGFIDIFIQNDDIGTLIMIGVEAPSISTSSYGSSNARVGYKGYLPRHRMYQEMQNSSVGIVPFRKHWSHKYISPNKAYEYAHAGLLVLCTSSLVPIRSILNDYCITFEDYDDMIAHLRYCKDNIEEIYGKQLGVYEFAKENLLWENYEQNIFDAYKAA